MLMIILAMISTKIKEFQLNHLGLAIFFGVMTIVICIVLLCYRNAARKVPMNYFLLFCFTFCESYLLSAVCAFTNPKVVLMAAVLTFAITGSLTFYACTTKTDFTMFGGFFYICAPLILLCKIYNINFI